jgi:hypothetical protein
MKHKVSLRLILFPVSPFEIYLIISFQTKDTHEPNRGIPFYECWNQNANVLDHYYATDWNELGYGAYG